MQSVVRGLPIRYDVVGSGRPVLVIHGTPLDHRSMESVLEPVFSRRGGWSRIYLDLPGHGDTPGAESITNNDQMVDVVTAFVENVIPGQRFALIGESYGGYLARGIVHHQATRIDGLFLWTPAKYPREERRKVPAPTVRVQDDRVAAGLASDAERDMFSMFIVQSQEAMDFARAHILPGFGLADYKFIDRMVNTKFSFDVESRPFQNPTLILCGRQDWVVGYQDAYDILNTYPMATLVIADGAGHPLGFTERTHLFDFLVNQWLDDVEHHVPR